MPRRRRPNSLPPAAPDSSNSRSRDNPARSFPLVKSIVSNAASFHASRMPRARAPLYKTTDLILLRDWNHATRGRTFNIASRERPFHRRAGAAIESNASKAEIRIKRGRREEFPKNARGRISRIEKSSSTREEEILSL